MDRIKLSEFASSKVYSFLGVFANLDAITVAVYKDGSATPEAMTTGTAVQIGTTGVFYYPLSDLVTPPTAFAEYYWTMVDATTKKYSGFFRVGGWVESASSGPGANSVTITVNDAVPVPILGVEVQVWNAAQTVKLDSKNTNSSGIVVFALDDGAYKVVLAKPQYSFTVPEDLTVSGTTTDTYAGAAIVITPSSGAGENEVSIFVSSQRPTVSLASLTGTAEIISLPAELSGVFYSGQKVNGTYDPANNRIYWVLPRSSTVQFKVSELGIEGSDAQKAITDAASSDYKDL
jgi:hypothetical protein